MHVRRVEDERVIVDVVDEELLGQHLHPLLHGRVEVDRDGLQHRTDLYRHERAVLREVVEALRERCISLRGTATASD